MPGQEVSLPFYEQVLDFLSKGPTADEITHFRPSQEAQERFSALLQLDRQRELTPNESEELNHYVQIDRIMSLVRAKAYRHLRCIGDSPSLAVASIERLQVQLTDDLDHETRQMTRWQHVAQSNLALQYFFVICCQVSASHGLSPFGWLSGLCWRIPAIQFTRFRFMRHLFLSDKLLGMLVYQGAIGLKMWSGLDAPIPVMHRALAHEFGASTA